MAEGNVTTAAKAANGAAAEAANEAAAEAAGAGAAQAPGAGNLLDPAVLLAVADSLPVMIAYLDPDARVQFCNEPVASWFERPRREIVGEPLGELIGGRTIGLRQPYLDKAMAGEQQFFVADYDHPSRGPLTVQIEYIPNLSADGKVAGIVLVVQDITERRVADLALRESEARFRRIADSAPVLIWVTRTDGSRDFVNEAYVAFSGIAADAARTHDWREFIHPEDFKRVVAESVAGEASGAPFTMEARFRRGDGAWRWLHAVSSPRLGPGGEWIGFIGVAYDVTPAKEAQSALREQVEERTRALADSEARFRAIFDSVMEVMVLLDPQGTVIEVNRTAPAWRAGSAQVAVGRPLWEAPTLQLYPGHEPLIREAIAVAARGETFSAEVPLEGDAARGTPSAWLDVSMQPVRSSGDEIDYILFEARDITELKGAQEQLRQSQKMEALGQLTGGIAHDFNNLLTVVVGGLDMLNRKLDDPKLKRYANNALTAAERGARLTSQLLTFSRSQRLEVRPCFVATVVEEMRPLLRNVLGPGIEKSFDLNSGSVPVLADPTQLEVAVLNLAINARDAMPGGGKLRFASRPVTIVEDVELDPGDYVELSISDTGVGMPPAVAARAFEPFFTTKEVGKGTGLGLSMVYGMARQSGGTARIASEPGRGTTVSLFFRRAESGGDRRGDQGSAPSLSAGEAQSLSVVVIDDDPDVRGFITGALAEFGYRVDEAADGASGVDLAVRTKPDVVVMDYVMPGMSGAEAAGLILAARPEQAILFVSGYSETDDIRSAAPKANLLPKPFRPDALDAAVRATLAGETLA